jgi:hypothetical protein
MNQDLMQKLVVAKKIMDKHENKPRGGAQHVPNHMVESYDAPTAKYNVPQEFLAEQPVAKIPQNQIPTQDRIMNSKLPDEIKRLMIEHPIEQPKMMGSETVLSDELVEAASRLMNTNQEPKQKNIVSENKQKSNINNEDIRSIIRETVEDVLRENGLIAESETKSNEVFKLRVGQHLFEGRVTNIKKIPKK